MRETKTLEFKKSVSNTFLKTVSAYANYGEGRILFGVTDDGEEVGIADPKRIALDIENRINDNIEPVPRYALHINEKTSVITLTVFEGLYKPYLYKSKAYRRNDSATIPVEQVELKRLIMEGDNTTFEEMPAEVQDLSFEVLKEKLNQVMHLNSFTLDTLKTLELYSDKTGYNQAAALLADHNHFSGIDIARFGDSINIIYDRETLEQESILNLYDKAVTMYRKYYQYEEIKGSVRAMISRIPEEAFREAVANAIVHRVWDVHTYIHISMFPDKIEIVSPGGLPSEINEEEYLRGGISVLRNRIIGGIFLRLGLIERFGTGIRRIQEEYRSSNTKPLFEVTDHAIRIVLPVINDDSQLTEDERKVYRLVKGRAVASSTVAEETGFGKSKTLSILKKLVTLGYIQTTGNGRGFKYTSI